MRVTVSMWHAFAGYFESIMAVMPSTLYRVKLGVCVFALIGLATILTDSYYESRNALAFRERAAGIVSTQHGWLVLHVLWFSRPTSAFAKYAIADSQVDGCRMDVLFTDRVGGTPNWAGDHVYVHSDASTFLQRCGFWWQDWPGFDLKIMQLQIPTIVLWAPFLLWMLWIIKNERRQRNLLALRGKCVQCGYDLRASKDRCPECGKSFATPSHAASA